MRNRYFTFSSMEDIVWWKKVRACEQESQHPVSSFPLKEEIDRQICRETYSSGISASFVLCNFRANINTLRSAAPSCSTLNSAPCIGLYVLRKQTNQYQSLKFPWLHETFHFKWALVALAIKKKKRIIAR